MNYIKPEVLSPVGSPESLQAAVRSGADAVYIGAKQFSARRNADNFDESQLKNAVQYCHIQGVKVYLALNVMLKQSELEDAFATAQFAYNCGVDGIIVQDIGLASLIHNYLPDIQLHASTQMSIHSPAALPILKEMGFSRVVVAREMSERELREFCEAAQRLQMEVEVFVHGALCMSVSGQCLLSSVLGARSGNRGLCAGPCRLPFAAEKGTGFDLSLKDLSLYNHIDKLCEMGVASLKIEGRMKRPEYVAAATAACRSAVDKGFVDYSLSDALQAVFSRSGFTDGYFTAKRGREMFGIRTRDDVISAKDVLATIHELYRSERQSVSISIHAKIKQKSPISLTISDGANEITVKGDIPQPAKNKALDEETVIASLKKFGNTPYLPQNIQIDLEQGLFVSASALNTLRREAAEKLDECRMAVTKNSKIIPDFSQASATHGGKKIIARFSSADQIPKNLDNVSAIMLPSECDFPDNLPDNIKLIADLPRFIINEKALKKRLDELKAKGITAAYCQNLSAVSIAKHSGFEIIGATGLNVCNNESLAALEQIGMKASVLSSEISLIDSEKVKTSLKKGIFAYGRLPLMLLRNCPLKNGRSCDKCDKKGCLEDRINKRFPIVCRNGYSELLNSAPLYLADKLNEIKDIDFMLLYFTDETCSECEKIIGEYTFGGTPRGEFTRGLYYKNLI